jgi:serine/threonine protein kinase
MLTCPGCGSEWSDSYKACPLDGAALVSAPKEMSQLGPYTIIGQLGGGGMARIYRALSPNNQEVALKVLFSSRNSSESITRFVLEGQILAALDHPNIVKVYEAGASAEGSHYLAMELLYGEDLSERLKRTGPISINEARELSYLIARGLSTVTSNPPTSGSVPESSFRPSSLTSASPLRWRPRAA